MSGHDRELILERRRSPAAAAVDLAPIVLLPDDVDIEREFRGEPELIAVRPHLEPASRRERPEPGKNRIARRPAPEPDPLLSVEEIERQINEELTSDRAGGRRLLSMPRFCRILAVIALSLLVLLLHVGWEYYRLPLVIRPSHHFHAWLRPSGMLGLSLGVLGTLVVLASLGYLVRKWLVNWRRLGSLQSWMGFHILTGLVGPAIVLFHTAFVPTSALGLLALSAMLVVVGSGIVGRYIAVHFPRSLKGREFKFEEVRRRLVVYRKKLTELGVDPALLRIDGPNARQRTPWLLTSIAGMVYGDWESRQEFRRLRQAVESREDLRAEAELAISLSRRLCWERQWLVRYGEFRRLVGAWRFLHRWLAVVLFVALFFHVVVGIKFGRLWIFGGR